MAAKNPSLDRLRAALGADYAGMPDEQLLMEASDASGTDPMQIAKSFGYTTGGKWGSRASSAVDNYQAGLYGLGEAVTGSDWMRQRRIANEQQAGFSDAVVRSKGGISSYKDVGGFGDAVDYVGGLAVQSFPYLLEAAAGGLAARGLSTGLRAAAATGEAGAAKSLAARQMAGGAAASYPSSVGDVLGNQRDQLRDSKQDDSQTDLLSAGLGGVAYAGLNYFDPTHRLASTGKLPGRVISGLDNTKGLTGGLLRAGGNAAVIGGVEGLNELGQEFVNQSFGRMAVDPNETFFNDKSKERFAESFVGGAALGGVLGGGAGGWRRSNKYYADQAGKAVSVESGVPTDLTTGLGFEGLHTPGPQAPNPLGDLTPDWTTAPGARGQTAYDGGIDPTGLYQAYGDPEPNTGVNPLGDQLQMPAVPGRPGMADVMAGGPTTEVAGTPEDAAAMGDPGTLEAIRRFNAQREEQVSKDEAVAAGRQQAAQRARDMTDLGLNPQDPKHQSLFAKMDEAVTKGVLTKEEAQQMVGQVGGGADPKTLLDAVIKPKLAEVAKTEKAAQKIKDTQSANLRTAAAEEQQGLLPAGALASVQDAIRQGHDGVAALKAQREVAKAQRKQSETAVRDAKKAADAAAEDAAKKQVADAAMAETKPNPPYVVPTAKVVQSAAPTQTDTSPVAPGPSPAPAAVADTTSGAPGAAPGQGNATTAPAAPVQPVAVGKKTHRVPKGTMPQTKAAEERAKKDAELDDAIEKQRNIIMAKKAAATAAKEGIVDMGNGPPLPDAFVTLLPDYIKLAVLYLKKAGSTFAGFVERMMDADPDLTNAQIRKIHTEATKQAAKTDFGSEETVLSGGQIDFDKLHRALNDKPIQLMAVRLVLGVDAQGLRTISPHALQPAAEKAGMGKNSGPNLGTLMSKLGIPLSGTAVAKFRQSERSAPAMPGVVDLDESAESDLEGMIAEAYGETDSQDDVDREFTGGPALSDEYDKSGNDIGTGAYDGLTNTDSASMSEYSPRRIDSHKHYKPISKMGLTAAPLSNLMFMFHKSADYITGSRLTGEESNVVRANAHANELIGNMLLTELQRRQAASPTSVREAARSFDRMLRAEAEKEAKNDDTEAESVSNAPESEYGEPDSGDGEEPGNRVIPRTRAFKGERLGAKPVETEQVTRPEDRTDFKGVTVQANGRTYEFGDAQSAYVSVTKKLADPGLTEAKRAEYSGIQTALQGVPGVKFSKGEQPTVSIVGPDGSQLVIADPGKALGIQGRKIDRLKTLLKCLTAG